MTVRKRDRTPLRSAADHALADLERLVAEGVAPVEAVRQWCADLPPELARSFASPWALLQARDFERRIQEARGLDDGAAR